MPPMTTYSFGDVVLVGFPFSHLQAIKKRPAVIVHSPAYREQPDVILMAITSQIRPSLMTPEMLLHDWQSAGLLKPSMLKPLVATIEKSKIIKRLGHLSNADRKRLSGLLQSVLGEQA
ncbi:PemK-like protein [Halochromatium salexigens]|uniref:PemK-like protein n=2 Tax=Halochromatium salexigens TaxID=49447 RepID=A0AAJ0XG73_HALSE|nr:PemK-like protein [Halochromatium salexigens]